MPATVIVNHLTVVHQSSSGISSSFPDVCKTPSPGGPIPIPYPNVAMSSDTADGSSTVKVDGNPIMLKSSNFKMSSGDEAGAAMGVASNKTKGKAYPKMYSFDVKVDGENVFRLGDIMLQNGGSPVNTGPAAVAQPNNAANGSGKAPTIKPPKLTKLKWKDAESVCGDETILEVETENVTGNLDLGVTVKRSQKEKALDTLSVPISGNKASFKWISRRGAWKKTVELTAFQRQLKGHTKSANSLKMKTVGDQGPSMISGTRTAPRYEAKKNPWYLRLIGRPKLVWVPTGQPDYNWGWAAELRIKNGELQVLRKVKFTYHGGASPTGQQLKQWKKEIETCWDRKFRIHRVNCKRAKKCDCAHGSGCCTYVIRVKCEWGGGHGSAVDLHAGANDPHHIAFAKVNPTYKWWFSNTWWMGMTNVPATVRAHEFGHLIGMYDEYPSGAAEKARLFADVPKSLMSSGSEVYERHFEDFHKWFDGKAGGVLGKTELIRI